MRHDPAKQPSQKRDGLTLVSSSSTGTRKTVRSARIELQVVINDGRIHVIAHVGEATKISTEFNCCRFLAEYTASASYRRSSSP